MVEHPIAAPEGPAPPGLYVHIPFCLRKCGYCSFYSLTDLSLIPAFLDALRREADLYRGWTAGRSFDTLYLGGGTPSVLAPADLEKLIGDLAATFPLAADAEITVEANPGDITADLLSALARAGVNRLNLGCQSFDDATLRLLGRRHSAAEALRAVELAREAGFANLGIDLIYGLPLPAERASDPPPSPSSPAPSTPDSSLSFPDAAPSFQEATLPFPGSAQSFPGSSQSLPDASPSWLDRSQSLPDTSQSLLDSSLSFPDGSPSFPRKRESSNLGGIMDPRLHGGRGEKAFCKGFDAEQNAADRWQATLETAVQLAPEHLSCYELSIEAGTPLAGTIRQGGMRLPGEALKARYFYDTSDFLTRAGYCHYEVSNFSRGGKFRARHNAKYWDHTPYLGLGPAAHSFDGRMRHWNHRSVKDYLRDLSAGRPPLAGSERLDDDQLRIEALFLGFRTREGIGLGRFRERYGQDLLAEKGGIIARLVREGLLEIVEGRLKPTTAGLAVADSLALI